MQAQRKPAASYTVADYLAWPDDVRCELLDGTLYAMSPAPVIEHQRVLGKLAFELSAMLRQKLGCELFTAPIDVVLSPKTVVQPDLIIVCDPAKLANGKYVDGAPDLVVEILSPSTAVKDKREKLRLYETHSVPEYLVVDPHEHYAERYRLTAESRYGLPDILGSGDTLGLSLFSDHARTLGELFGWPADDLALGPAR